MALPHQLISTAFVREQDEVTVVFLTTPPKGTTPDEYYDFTTKDSEAFAKTLRRKDLTRTDDRIIGLFHQRRGLLALLAGPKTAPAQLQLTAAVDLESTVPTVVLGGTDDEPQTWLVFETIRLPEKTAPEKATPEKTPTKKKRATKKRAATKPKTKTTTRRGG